MYFFIFCLCRVFIAVRGLSLDATSRGSLWCLGFCSCDCWAPEHRLGSCGAGLSCSVTRGNFQVDQGWNPASFIVRRILSLSPQGSPKCIYS